MKQTRRPTRTTDRDNKGSMTSVGNSSITDLKPGKFYLEAPFAKSVQLAADFTKWEKNPLDLMKSKDGTWMLVLPLPPGNHPYRFLVDGQWRNDPQAIQSIPNPFGTENSIKVVA